MVVHWWRRPEDPHRRRSLFFNATGCVLSATVFITAAITKFTAGAWVALLAVALFIALALRIRHHYDLVGRATALHPHSAEVPEHRLSPIGGRAQARADPSPGAAAGSRASGDDDAEVEENPLEIHNLTLVPVSELHLASLRAMAYAASLEQPVLALHVSPTEDEARRFRHYWQVWGDHLPLEVIVSPHRAVVAPLINYISSLHRQRPDLTVTVVLPEIVVRHWWHRALHNRTTPRLRRALRPLTKLVVTTVPFHLPA